MLSQIISTRAVSGFLASSPKIILTLDPNTVDVNKTSISESLNAAKSGLSNLSLTPPNQNQEMGEWKCPICDAINVETLKCILCGVPRLKSQSSSNILTQELKSDVGKVACRICTFLNAQDRVKCGIHRY